jgi:hypothetical protein
MSIRIIGSEESEPVDTKPVLIPVETTTEDALDVMMIKMEEI